MSHALIRSLLEQRLSQWASAKTLRVALQGLDFVPQAGETWLKPLMLPVSTDSSTLGADLYVYTGSFQISIVTPLGSGAGLADTLVDELAALFPAYLRLSRDDFAVMVLTPVKPAPGVQDATTYTVAASFQYRADTY
jgi:hypothetical protein